MKSILYLVKFQEIRHAASEVFSLLHPTFSAPPGRAPDHLPLSHRLCLPAECLLLRWAPTFSGRFSLQKWKSLFRSKRCSNLVYLYNFYAAKVRIIILLSPHLFFVVFLCVPCVCVIIHFLVFCCFFFFVVGSLTSFFFSPPFRPSRRPSFVPRNHAPTINKYNIKIALTFGFSANFFSHFHYCYLAKTLFFY